MAEDIENQVCYVMCSPLSFGSDHSGHAVVRQCGECGCDVWRDVGVDDEASRAEAAGKTVIPLCLPCVFRRMDSEDISFGGCGATDEQIRLVSENLGLTPDEVREYVAEILSGFRTLAAVKSAGREFTAALPNATTSRS